MVPEAPDRRDRCATRATCARRAGALIGAANAAGGRDNITVVLFRVEDVGDAGGRAPTAEQPTEAGAAAPRAAEVARGGGHARPRPADRRPRPRPAPAHAAPRPARRRRRAGSAAPARRAGGVRSSGTAVVVALLAMVLAGGWFATRAVYFVGHRTARAW